MSATTITGQEALFAIAEEVGEIRSEYINEVITDNTVFRARGISLGQSTSFKYALARIPNRGIRQVTAYDDGRQAVTVASNFTSGTAAGEMLEVIFWEAKKRQMAFNAVNEAIRLSWPFWYQEVIVDAAASAITLDDEDDEYDLPTACDGLIAVGIQPATTQPIRWYPPFNQETGQTYYVVEGSPGAYVIRFAPKFNRFGAFNVMNDGLKLCTWYATKEPALTTEAGTTQLPKEYFSSVGAEIYRRRMIGSNQPDGDEKVFQSLQELARNELQRLGYGKRPINALMDQFKAAEEE